MKYQKRRAAHKKMTHRALSGYHARTINRQPSPTNPATRASTPHAQQLAFSYPPTSKARIKDLGKISWADPRKNL